jgi:hypothetical protein
VGAPIVPVVFLSAIVTLEERRAETNEGTTEPRWEALWEHNSYEDEYYYVSQLFEPNWQPRIMA